MYLLSLINGHAQFRQARKPEPIILKGVKEYYLDYLLVQAKSIKN